MLKKVKINIFSLIIFITLTACQTVTDKIDQSTELEKKELSKWLNKSEEVITLLPHTSSGLKAVTSR